MSERASRFEQDPSRSESGRLEQATPLPLAVEYLDRMVGVIGQLAEPGSLPSLAERSEARDLVTGLAHSILLATGISEGERLGFSRAFRDLVETEIGTARAVYTALRRTKVLQMAALRQHLDLPPARKRS